MDSVHVIDSSALPKTNTRKRFTPQEDKIILALVSQGVLNWDAIAKKLPGRSGRQIKDRYNGYLSQKVIQRPWTFEEDNAIMQLFSLYGAKWTLIAKHLNGRSGSNVKNRWYKAIVKNHPDFSIKMKNLTSKTMLSSYTPTCIPNALQDEVSSDDDYFDFNEFNLQDDINFDIAYI